MDVSWKFPIHSTDSRKSETHAKVKLRVEKKNCNKADCSSSCVLSLFLKLTNKPSRVLHQTSPLLLKLVSERSIIFYLIFLQLYLIDWFIYFSFHADLYRDPIFTCIFSNGFNGCNRLVIFPNFFFFPFIFYCTMEVWCLPQF